MAPRKTHSQNSQSPSRRRSSKKPKKPKEHTAIHSFASYIYQFFSLIPGLCRMDEGHTICLEVVDDISFINSKGVIDQLEQVHYQIQPERHNNPIHRITDNFPKLWQTLGIWCEEIRKNAVKLEFIHELVFVTLAIPADGTIGDLLKQRRSADALAAIKKYLRNPTSKDKKVRIYLEQIRAIPEKDLNSLVMRIRWEHERPNLDQMENTLKTELKRRCFHEKDLDKAAHEIMGWLLVRVSSFLDEGKGPRISQGEFTSYLANLRDNFSRGLLRPKYINKIISKMEQRNERDKRYLKQLSIIRASENRKIRAIENYLKSRCEFQEWLARGEIVQEDYNHFLTKLVQHWRPRHENMCDAVRGRDHTVLAQHGLELFDEIEKCALCFKEAVRDYGYITHGTFQVLADNNTIPLVGWHPFFERLLTKNSKNHE